MSGCWDVYPQEVPCNMLESLCKLFAVPAGDLEL